MSNNVNIILVTLFYAGIVVLQIFLSRSERRWPGLILPGISVLFSLLVVLSYATFSTMTTMTQNGEAVTQNMPISTGGIVAVVSIFLLCNIPTAILLAICAAARNKRKKAAELEKMSVQELE